MGGIGRIELAKRAQQDVRRLAPEDRRRVRRALERLAAGAEGLDLRPLDGARPWMRLRSGDHRLLLRRLTRTEGKGWLVARVVHRSELERAVDSLR